MIGTHCIDVRNVSRKDYKELKKLDTALKALNLSYKELSNISLISELVEKINSLEKKYEVLYSVLSKLDGQMRESEAKAIEQYYNTQEVVR